MADPVELAAIDRGAGTAVVLVHGGVFHSGPAWARSLGPLLDSGFRVIAVDRRGHGRSEPGDADRVPVHLHADDLRLTLELREVEEAHLVGVSYGSLVCLEHALSWPQRSISMTLVEPPLFSWLRDDPDYAELLAKFRQVSDLARSGAQVIEWVPRWLGLIDSSMARQITPESPSWSLIERQAPLVMKEEAGWEYEPNLDRLDALSVPGMVVNGDRSEPAMQLVGEFLAERLTNGSHVLMPGASHELHARDADRFNPLLIDFLRKHDPER